MQYLQIYIPHYQHILYIQKDDILCGDTSVL